MKKGWESKALNEVSAINYGYTESASTEPVGPRFLRITDIQNDHVDWSSVPYCNIEPADLARYRLASGDIVFARTGATTGKSFLISEPPKAVFASYLIRLRLLNQALMPEFVSLFFQTDRYWRAIREGSAGSAQGGFNATKLGALRIPVPPLPEQRRIVGILDEAFAAIATAQANTEKNLQNARALFESHLQSVFTQLGKGRKMVKLEALTELARGHNPPKREFSRERKPGYVRFYQIRDGANDDYAVYVPDTRRLHKMKKDDIMMVAYRHIGRAFRGVEGAFNVALCKISNARRDILDDDYLFHLIPSRFIKGELLKRSERSLIPSMSVEHLRELQIPLPPISQQKQVVQAINALYAETQRLAALYERKLAALAALKKSLLQQAFNGEL